MKYIQALCMSILIVVNHIAYSSQDIADKESLHLNIPTVQHQKSKLALIVVGIASDTLRTIVPVIKKDLEFGGQFDIGIHEQVEQPHAKHDITHWAPTYPLAIFIYEDPIHNAIDWYIYETGSAYMVAGKKYAKRGTLERGWAHNIADAVWPLLTGQDGFFSTKIAYCQEVPGRKGRKYKHIYIADYDGSNPQSMVRTPTINVAPRFNQDKNNPLLFYSESTNENIRLAVMTMDRRCKTASNFDGVNMLPSFSADGTKVVYCASHGHGSCQLYCYDKGVCTQITHTSGNNISPTFSDDGTKIYFCSDYDGGKPQVYCYNLLTHVQTAITAGSESCYCPAYCHKNKNLAYVKMVKGCMQLFTYNEVSGEHKQLTYDIENKEECSWSPCGNYVLYAAEKGMQGRIAMINVFTKERHYLTPTHVTCSYPTWSPTYTNYPVIA